MSELTIYNEIALKIKGQQKELEKLRKELKLAEENEEYWHNAFSDLEDEYDRLRDTIELAERNEQKEDKYKRRCIKALTIIYENYGLLDKYGIEMIEDILEGIKDE